MSNSGIEGDPLAGGELPHDELIELARVLNDHVSGYRTGGARDAAAAIMRAGYRRQLAAGEPHHDQASRLREVAAKLRQLEHGYTSIWEATLDIESVAAQLEGAPRQ